MDLSEPLDFFPISNERFSFRAGLNKPGNKSDIASGSKIFLIDKEFKNYRANKMAARKEDYDKYILTGLMDEQAQSILSEYIIRQLLSDYPEYFSLKKKDDCNYLTSSITEEILLFDNRFRFLNAGSHTNAIPGYDNSLDALACQVQDDLVLVQVDENGQDAITAIHLCAPNHWSAEEKYGNDFIATHENVPNLEYINQQSKKMMHSLVHKGPYVRFAWGLSSNTRLNHHPASLAGMKDNATDDRCFNLEIPALYLRTERQAILGIPELNGFLFTIRTYFMDICKISDKGRLLYLIKSIESMDTDTAIYKGIFNQKSEILKWLKTRLEL